MSLFPQDGPYTGKWVSHKVTGKYARIEMYQVGQRVNAAQYEVFRDGNRKFSAVWGHMAIEGALTLGPPRCGNCDKIRPDGDYLCFFMAVCTCGWKNIERGYWTDAMKIAVLEHYVENLRSLLVGASCPNCGQQPVIPVKDDLTKHS